MMMRITREEEHIGGIRPAVHGRVKAGFAKDGRLLAVDMATIGENSAYEAQGDAASGSRFVSLLYQPEAMKSRAITVLTNTPPRRAQSQPGGLQAIMIFEPVMAKAARKLGIDQVAIRRMNAPEGKAKLGPANREGSGYAPRAFIKEALDRGKEVFGWDERKARRPAVGSKVRGVGVAVSSFVAGSVGFDGLFVIAGRPDAHPVRRRQPRHRVGLRRAPRRRRDDGRAVGEGVDRLGRHVAEPSVDLRVRRQPDDARDDPCRSRRGLGRHRQGAGDRRQGDGRQPRGLQAGQRAHLRAGGSMSLADVAKRAIRWAASSTATSCPRTSTR